MDLLSDAPGATMTLEALYNSEDIIVVLIVPARSEYGPYPAGVIGEGSRGDLNASESIISPLWPVNTV